MRAWSSSVGCKLSCGRLADRSENSRLIYIEFSVRCKHAGAQGLPGGGTVSAICYTLEMQYFSKALIAIELLKPVALHARTPSAAMKCQALNITDDDGGLVCSMMLATFPMPLLNLFLWMCVSLMPKRFCHLWVTESKVLVILVYTVF